MEMKKVQNWTVINILQRIRLWWKMVWSFAADKFTRILWFEPRWTHFWCPHSMAKRCTMFRKITGQFFFYEFHWLNWLLFNTQYMRNSTIIYRLTPSLAQRQLWPDTHFGPEILRPETTSARKQLRPRKYFGPVNTSAQKILRPRKYFGPEILRPGNNFGPIDFGPLHFGPGTKLSKVSFFIIFDLP